jgi:hypothetical protein
LHHYQGLTKYPELYADHRAVSGGRPMWVSECSVLLRWNNEQYKELSEASQRIQSKNLTKTYTLGIHEGAKTIFYFILQHHAEGAVQYGLLHEDFTPRPGYVALAAVGRLLADAKPLGRLKTKEDFVHAYLFDAKPDGNESKVLVAWSTNATTFALPKSPQACYDHLGRVHKVEGKTVKLDGAPLYFIFPKKTSFDVTPPPKTPKWLPGKPGHLVLQALPAESDIVVEKSAYKMATGETKTIPIFLYNFGAKEFKGKLHIKIPEGWTADFPTKTKISPGERKELPLKLTCVAAGNWDEAKVRIEGDFGRQEKPVLSFRLTPDVID